MNTVIDLSKFDRLGLKGRGAEDWLTRQGIELPDRPNRLLVRADGTVVARYAEREFALANFNRKEADFANLRRALEDERPEGCYSVPRADSQAAFGLSGGNALQVLSAICPADLRPRAFGRGDVLQTLCAGVSAQLWNLPDNRVIVLCDSSVGHHQQAAIQTALDRLKTRSGLGS